MYKISGKQKYGSVWHNGECIVLIRQGVGTVSDDCAAEYLKSQGYVVEPSADSTAVSPVAKERSAKKNTSGRKA